MPVNLKKKVCAKCEKQSYIFGRQMCKSCYYMDLADRKRGKPRSSIKKRKKRSPSSNKIKKQGRRAKSITSLKKKLWGIFSKFVRLRDSDDYGFCICITSGQVLFWKKAQAGHFISRRYNSTFVHEKNVHAQSPYDNCYLSGNQYIYGKRLDEIYGEGTADYLVALSKEDKKFTVEELEELIVYYDKKVKELLHKKGLVT
jgi:hypothetical protein